ncbi:hypothetical protein [Asticcacaulis sp. EMRT-3]|uniref:hypothetical protein n=1 Tax=Asticcacaulis sp. EMRT-3 TaxID=3040349 RepID=UPI0024AF34F0|nr:hypothetical protein [Asticcacaulis sp. EMRT-3]MDI7774698.1 hypothetical protein [Asticcacaulis sp. EMRT-3]
MPLLEFPEDMFRLREGEVPMYGEFPDLKKGVRFFVSLMPDDEWSRRREAVAKRFYNSLISEPETTDEKGRFFDERDQFAWFLFLGESFTDHPQNYEPVYGCRVIPILAAIGRNLDTLHGVEGFVEKAQEITAREKSQPNGGLFEILVAAAYARAGWKVKFKPRQRGIARTHDLDVEKDGKHYAVECKRIEGGEYIEQERARMRQLWKPPSAALALQEQRSTLLTVRFNVELNDVPDTYLSVKVGQFIKSGLPAWIWHDGIGVGILKNLDLGPIQESLKKGYILHPGPVFNKTLTGSYVRYDSLVSVLRMKYAPNPHFIDEIDLAVLARWSSHSEAAIEKKARDIQSKLVEANSQLPTDAPGIIHIGFEALSGDDVEQRRYEKIIQRVRSFNPAQSKLEFVYCHYFAPEAPVETAWAFDETFQWHAPHNGSRPLEDVLLVVPENNGGPRHGVHWDGQNVNYTIFEP